MSHDKLTNMLYNKKIVQEVEKIVHAGFKSKKNHAGYSAWSHHVIPAVKYAKILAKKLGADEEIVELATLLHDYGSVSFGIEKQDEHHLTGAQLAQEVLEKLSYPQNRIDKIKHCILAHRATKCIKRESLEAEIIASADAMSHFAYVNDLFWMVYVPRGMETEKGTEFVLKKLENSYKKLMPEAKGVIDEKYDAIKKALTNDIIES